MGIKSAIVFTVRNDLRDAVRQELKSAGLSPGDIHNVRTLVEYKGAQKEVKTAFQILDWEVNPEDLLLILKENSKQYKVDTDPVFLLAAKLDPHVMAVAHEFNVSHVHAGEISRDLIKNEVRAMVQENKNLEPIKQVFCKIEKLYSQGNLEGAGKILQQLYEKAPNNLRVVADLAENLMQQDLWDEAMELLLKIEETKPRSARIKHLLAKCYLKQSQHEKAIEALEGAQVVNPYNVERLLELGNILLPEKPQEAKEKFNEILSFSPKSKSGKMGKGSAMLLLGEVNEALGMLKDAVNSRELASIFNTSAILSIKSGNHGPGIELYKTALSALGRNNKVQAKLMYNMGIGYVKWSKRDLGLECFEKAVELDPAFRDAAYNMNVMGSGKKAVGYDGPQDLSGLEESLQSSSDGHQLSFSTDFEDDFE